MNSDNFREQAIQFNKSLTKKYVHEYASGIGLCADLVGVLKMVVRCWVSGYQFTLGAPKSNTMRDKQFGWQEVFAPTFPVTESRYFHRLNRRILPLQGRFPVSSHLAGAWLRFFADGDLFVPEARRLKPIPDRIVFPSLEFDEPFWEGMRKIANAIYQPNQEIVEFKEIWQQKLDLNGAYIAVHVRRGDKFTEASYTEIESYMRIIEEKCESVSTIYIASDDFEAVKEFEDNLPSTNVVTMARITDKGYDQSTFNTLSANAKRAESVRFITELWLMLGAQIFIGSSTSNIYNFLRYMRGNLGIFDAEEIV